MSGSTFALDLKAFADKAKARADDMVGITVFGLAEEVMKRSPVGDRDRWAINIERKARGLPPVPKGYLGGHFRANWQIGVGVRPAGEIAGIDKSGAETLGKIAAEIPDQAAGKVYWLVNNTPYSVRLEYGHSKIAPPGFIVGGSVAMFQQKVRDAVEAVQ